MGRTGGDLSKEVIAGLAKGLAILERYGAGIERLTVSEAAQGSGTSPASARRCLRTLTLSGYLRFDGKYYFPTPRLMRLSSAYINSSELLLLAQPILDAARDELNESVSLSVRDGELAVFVARAEVLRIVTAAITVGTRIPMFISASGHALMSGLSAGERAELFEQFGQRDDLNEFTLTLDQAKERIADVAERGYAYNDEDLEPGVSALAVPVYNSRGGVEAALAVSVLSSRVSMQELIDNFKPALTKHAQELGKSL